MFIIISRFFVRCFILFLYQCVTCAGVLDVDSDNEQDYIPDLGEVGRNVSNALMGISDLWLAIATITGIGFLFAGTIKYYTHRKNPQQTPLSHVFTFIILGVVLIGLSYVVKYGGTTYAFIKQVL